MKKKPAAVALVDLLVTVAAAVLLVSVAVPSLSHVRELSKRTLCSVNLSGIGAAANVYAASNSGSWMVPPFKRSLINNSSGGVDYLPPSVPVGFERQYQTRSDTSNQANAEGTAMSVTRASWMLVRSGDVRVKQFVCPSSASDLPDPTENTDLYYDFTSYSNISYGYQVPFGPPDTRAREGMDNRQIIAADKGPFYLPSTLDSKFYTVGDNRGPIELTDSPKNWRLFNSSNHGGQANGEGENVLFPDGHASFARIPASGIDDDNIYTLMLDKWGALPGNRIHGSSPHNSAAVNPYPGQDALGVGPGAYAATDSLIFP